LGCIAYSKRPLQPSCSLAMKFNFHLVFNMIWFCDLILLSCTANLVWK
jgi:hypothetical protein